MADKSTAPSTVPNLWDPYNFASASATLPDCGQDAGRHPASDPMILEAALLCDPTITEVEVDPMEVTSNKVDHAGVTVDQGGMEVPPSTPTKAHSMAVLLADCMVAGPQAEAADGTATGGATTEPSAKDMPTPREAAKRLARFIEEVQVMRLPPLINTPPKQKPAPKANLAP